jgi:Protein of unknown function (DUF3048) N-terminal domain/Protein of unknown function (DUF3048) C-terminal domain
MVVSRRTLGLVAALAIAAAACSSGTEATTTTTTAAPTTTASSTTTASTSTSTSTATTTTALEVADTINGLPGEPGTEARRVIGIKIDNHPAARPQSGIQDADAVYEILVEGGLTRFIALFHQSDSDYVGPVRSGRPTDSKVMRALNGPLQISGFQGWVSAIFKADGTKIIGDNGVTTFRMSHRSAPHNLYTTTAGIREYSDDRGIDDDPPPPLFTFGEPTPPTEDATEITFDWSNAPDVVWSWDGEQYLRFNGTEPHEWVNADGVTGQIATDTIVVLMGHRYTASPPNGSGSSVPAIETTGTGKALVFTDGGVIAGEWSRPEITDTFELTTSDGNPIVIAPGHLWMAVFPDNRTVTWE